MCGPFADAAGSLLKAGISIAGGIAERTTSRRQARLLEANARGEREIGRVEADRIRRNTERILGEQREQFARGGVDITVGRPVDIFAESVAEGELDALLAIHNRGERARGLENRAAIQRARGKNAFVSGFLSAGASVLTGASSIAEQLGTGGGDS